MNELHQVFCPVPFTFMNISPLPDFHIMPCCWLHQSLGSYREGVDFFDEIWNSDIAQKIRKSILDGTFQYCSKKDCPHLNNNTLPLRDNISDPFLKEVVEKEKVILDRGPSTLHFDHDQSCNLTCPSCRKDKILYNGGKELKDLQIVWEGIVNSVTLPKVKEINLTGAGDPFSSVVYLNFLENFKSDIYPDLKINLFSNGVMFNKKMWERIRSVRGNIQDVKISLDAASEDVYRKVRKGGCFNKVLGNVRFLSCLKRDGFFRDLVLCFVVQDHNFLEMVPFVELAESIGDIKVHFQRVINWGAFTEQEFLDRAIYETTHPQYKHFIEELKNPIFKKDFVDMGNLSPFLDGE